MTCRTLEGFTLEEAIKDNMNRWTVNQSHEPIDQMKGTTNECPTKLHENDS